MNGKKIRARTRDAAFTYRMGAGFPGTVNRMHPASIIPRKINTTTPPLGYGYAVLNDGATSSVRQVAAGDTAVTVLSGVAVRPYPTQQTSGGMSSSIGTAAPPPSGVLDVLRAGFISVRVNGTPQMGGAVFVWCAADSGAHIQGTFESAASAGNTMAIANARFNGVPDANGNVEIEVWPA